MSVVKMKNLFVLFYLFAFFSSWGQNDRKAFVDSLLSGIEVKKDIRYNSGERPLLLDIYYPERNNDKPLPCVVWIHGGGLTDTTIQKDYDLIRWGAARTVKNGYLTVSINYRLINESPLPAAIQDCLTSIRFLKNHAAEYRIDTTRIAVVGESAGGYLAGICSFTCNANIFTTKDWPHSSNNITCGVLWYPAVDRWEYNMLDYISPDDIPVISIHGNKDDIVPVNKSYLIQSKCKEKGIDFKLYTIDGADHGFFNTKWNFDELNRKYTEQAIDITIAFLDKKLK